MSKNQTTTAQLGVNRLLLDEFYVCLPNEYFYIQWFHAFRSLDDKLSEQMQLFCVCCDNITFLTHLQTFVNVLLIISSSFIKCL